MRKGLTNVVSFVGGMLFILFLYLSYSEGNRSHLKDYLTEIGDGDSSVQFTECSQVL